jgi:hypothetical protein
MIAVDMSKVKSVLEGVERETQLELVLAMQEVFMQLAAELFVAWSVVCQEVGNDR